LSNIDKIVALFINAIALVYMSLNMDLVESEAKTKYK